jgi:hypothetical protein
MNLFLQLIKHKKYFEATNARIIISDIDSRLFQTVNFHCIDNKSLHLLKNPTTSKPDRWIVVRGEGGIRTERAFLKFIK